jgi:hypothetical protein
LDGVAVAAGQHLVAPYPWWWVVDLADGVTIEDSSRVLVEVPQDEVGCGDEDRPIGASKSSRETPVSFELVHREPGERPLSWFGEIGTSFESEPAVLVRAELDNAVARELVGRNIAHHVRTRRRPTAQATARSWTAQELQPVPDRRITATPSSSVPVRCRSDS